MVDGHPISEFLEHFLVLGLDDVQHVEMYGPVMSPHEQQDVMLPSWTMWSLRMKGQG